MSLKAIAISAPEYPFGRISTTSLTSRDPVSLYNACRYAACLAENHIGPWGDSNWAIPRKSRKQNLLLMNSLAEEISYFEELLAREKPNLLLIGAMTVCFPGAVECAKTAKQMFGKNIYVVLGGRHVNETIYTDKTRTLVKHHNGSPLKLMAEGKIDPIFDLVVSGEGEFVIAKIGEVVADTSIQRFAKISSSLVLQEISGVPGNWIAGFLGDNSIKTLISENKYLDRDQLSSPAKMFGINTEFNVFSGRLTGHAFSDTSTGCIYDCDFCSERNSVCGPLMQVETSSTRLFRQLIDIYRVISEDGFGRKASAFIEDSIILGGLSSQLTKFDELLKAHPIDIIFGGQLTIDMAIKQKEVMKELARRGLEYIFIGLETFDPNSIGGMNKDIGKESWIDRAERMIGEYSDIGMKTGAAILFGLGETQNQRIALLQRLTEWKKQYKNPVAVSFNWAVQHPLKGNDSGAGYDYLEWAVNSPEYIKIFKDYGEASTVYGIPGVSLPELGEFSEIQDVMQEIN